MTLTSELKVLLSEYNPSESEQQAKEWVLEKFYDGSDPTMHQDELLEEMTLSARPDAFIKSVFNTVKASKYHDQGGTTEDYLEALAVSLSTSFHNELKLYLDGSIDAKEWLNDNFEAVSALFGIEEVLKYPLNESQIADKVIHSFAVTNNTSLNAILSENLVHPNNKQIALETLA